MNNVKIKIPIEKIKNEINKNWREFLYILMLFVFRYVLAKIVLTIKYIDIPRKDTASITQLVINK